MLFVIMMSGMLYTSATLEINSDMDEKDCNIIASELRKNDKVSTAFCILAGDNDEDPMKVVR